MSAKGERYSMKKKTVQWLNDANVVSMNPISTMLDECRYALFDEIQMLCKLEVTIS